ncbi:hypothetical protein [Bacterioplanoides sp.]|uniref:hypothetical protein n=1 Tax=Bacterioplanoides sp. TaxID=2066072 RepID=UPI003B5CCCAF
MMEQMEQSEKNHSLSLTKQGLKPVPKREQKREQAWNIVPLKVEQLMERPWNTQPLVFLAVPKNVPSCSTLFHWQWNTLNAGATRDTALFLLAVPFVPCFLTPLLENLMTRLPRTPAQTAADQRKAQLIRYLIRQSEERQVIFLRSLSDSNLRFDLQNQLAEHQRGQHDEPESQSKRETEL